MTLTQALKSCLITNYATFSGRATRSEFWLFKITVFFISFVVYVLLNAQTGDWKFAYITTQVLVSIPTLLPSLAVYVRRFHDTGRSTKSAVLVLAIYYSGAVVSRLGEQFVYAGLALTIVATIYSLWVLLSKSVSDEAEADPEDDTHPEDEGTLPEDRQTIEF